jgi:general secretion pathway protein D
MIEVFDVDWMRGMSFALLPVDVADVTELVGELETVFLQDGNSPLAGMIRFAPIERLNAVLVISSQPAYLDQAQTWVERLDRGAEGAGRRIFVYYVENGQATELAAILSDIFAEARTEAGAVRRGEVAPGLTPVEVGRTAAGRTAAERAAAGRTPAERAAAPPPRQGGQPAGPEGRIPTQEPSGTLAPAPRAARTLARRFGATGAEGAIGGFIQESGDIRVIADEATNSLVILATASEFRMIEATLRRLDILPLQVLVEATILEVSLSDNLQSGVQWFFESGNFFTQFVTTAVAPEVPGFSFLFDSNDKAAVVNALAEVTDIKVISSPSVMVLDNQNARLQVGDQVPFETGTTIGEGGTATSTVQQIDTGVVLTVTPRINAGGLVTLEVSQEVSQATPTEGATLNPTISQRQIQSTVAVQSGETLALGGLIRDNRSESVNGVPILMDIPLLGNLFKTTTETIDRVELLVLLTPSVVRNQAEARKVTDELRKRLKTIEPLEQRIFEPRGST